MSLPNWIVEATPDNYRQLVLANSHQGPVMVYFWAPDAGPCNILLPRLIKVGEEFGGRFLLALLNTNEHKRFANDLGIFSIPTVKLVHNGAEVENVQGAYSEKTFRDMVSKYLPQEHITVHGDALKAWKQGKSEQAMVLMDKAIQENPGNLRLPLDKAKILLQSGNIDGALDTLTSLPEEARQDSEISVMTAHLSFLQAAENAPPLSELETSIDNTPDDLDVRFQAAAQHVVNDEYEPALKQLLEIVKRDSKYREDLGRKGMLAVIRVIGEKSEISEKYRDLLRKALH